jgi:hypothetical protein
MAPGALPETAEVVLRRYRCLSCGAVIVVGPQGLLRGWLYSAPAIAWALWLYGVARRTAAQVRRQVSAWPTVGATAAAGWAALRRWARAVRRRVLFAAVRPCPASFSLREVAARAATTAAACAPPADRERPQAHQAWRGALQLGRAIAM